jgi:hypothetical protein
MGLPGLAPAYAARQSDLHGSDRPILHRAETHGKCRQITSLVELERFI